mgnify:CR=1 FL=1
MEAVEQVFSILIFQFQPDFELQRALLIQADEAHSVQIELGYQVHKLLVRVVPEDDTVAFSVEEVA